ncbi:AfsR/SARP family transcriptional regulator [Amycolatopsis alba]|uniref:XRE family transcriptional regulator n=1 Tax=Amycolatopsis alba DSM 44262 TaxID=1125972 RepID=A0A229RSK0_AMYAL|nr:BTAD domain-containing putative transcriptional regulator [Amycolatopsis alba]OXM49653.1 XRE family transcriptional regulator [Amycolatopsis alba DSM 44262]
MEFQVLGSVTVRAGGQVFAVGEPRQQHVLAVLLLEAGRTVGLDTLVSRVWGESPPKQARRSLQAHITRIRRVLEQAEPGSSWLARDAGGYRLDISPDQVDVFRFRNALRDGATDREALTAALDLWRGEPLAGLPGEWAERVRRTLGQEHEAAVVAWAVAEIRAGQAAATIIPLTELVEEHPLHEGAAAVLMRALYAVARTADALAVHERTRRALRDELGVDPGPELAAVHEAVLRHDLPPGEQGPPAVPAQLPAAVAEFTGRADETAELDRLAARAGDEPVIACLTGTAGAGKTATVVQWGHRMRDRFPDGQLYLDLRGYAPEKPVSPDDALGAFLTALLPVGAEVPLGATERAARFRTALDGRRMLVVLDNAASVEQVRMLLPGTGGCAVVVTSRDALPGLVALHGAHRVTVDQLPVADAVTLLRRLIGRRVDAEPGAAAELAERCVRLPLTLRLAAELAVSRPAVPLSRLAAELGAAQRTLDVLSSGEDQRAAIRAVFSWSLRQLSDQATDAFAALGRHPVPTFDVHGLAALAGQPLETAQVLLNTLVRAHLVHPAGVDRYLMHDLLKAYARETGSIDESAALDRVYAYYLATIAAAMDRLYPGEAHRRPAVPAVASPVPGFDGTDGARDWLDAELAMMPGLSAHAAAHGRPETSVTLSRLLFRYLDGRNETVAISIHDQAHAAAHTTGDRAGEATALHALGGVHLQAGRADAAVAHLRAASALFKEIGDLSSQGRAVAAVGMVEERAGHYRPAIDHYSRALALFRHDTDLVAQAHVLTRLGTTEARIGHAAAVTNLDHAMALHRQAGHPFGQAWAKLGLAEIAITRDHLSDALALHTEAVELFRTVGHRGSEAWGIDGLGRTHTLRGHPDRAAEHHRRALDLFVAHGDRDGETWALNGLGEACRADGAPASARAHHTAALDLADRTGAQEQAARAHHGLARAAADTGDLRTARRHYDRATTLYRDLTLPAADVIEKELADLR